MKTAELTGNELDRWVARALGWHEEGDFWYGPTEITGSVTRDDNPVQAEVERFHPSRSWAQGGPIIEREGISVEFEPSADGKEQWLAQTCMRDAQFANTPLIAAMRCYVALKLGN